jgi:hypothetical protein
MASGSRARMPGSRPARKKLGPRGVEYRRVFVVGHSLAVTLTPGCARLLGVEGGGTVQVVPHISGKVIIAPVRMRLGAQRELVSAARELQTCQRELLKAKKRLLALPVRQVARGFGVGYMKAQNRSQMEVAERLESLTDAVTGLCALVGPLVNRSAGEGAAPPSPTEARDALSGEVVPAVVSEGPASP